MLVWLKSPRTQNREFILLDRDGVFNKNSPEYVKSIAEVHFYPDALEALAILNRKNVSAIVISNQSGINRGLIAWDDFWEMHDGVIHKVEERGGEILAAYYCPHRPDEHCECRKPLPAMILAACRQFLIDPAETSFIGDSETDIQAAQKAGCRAIRLCREGTDQEDCRESEAPVYSNLLDAVRDLYGKR